MSSSGMDRDVYSLMLSIQHFLCRPWRRPPSKVPCNRLSCAPSRRCGEVSSGTLFRKLGSFSQIQQQFTAIEEDGGDKRLVQLALA